MNVRLQQFLSAENMSQSQLADRLGVAKASISHIIAGRNKPGFDLILALSRQFPDLNLEWLITGSGKMYKGPQSPAPAQLAAVSEQIVHQENTTFTEEGSLFYPPIDNTKEKNQIKATEYKEVNTIQVKQNSSRNISKIVVFYDDNTFQELK